MENSNNLIKAENGCVKMTRIHNEGSNDSIVQAEKIQSLQSNLGLEDRPPFRDKAKQFLDYEERASFVSLESRIKRKLDKLARRAKEYPLDDSGNTDFVCDILGGNIYYDSIAGHIINLLEHLPEEGETIVDDFVEYKVANVEKNRIEKVHILLLPKEEGESEEDTEKETA